MTVNIMYLLWLEQLLGAKEHEPEVGPMPQPLFWTSCKNSVPPPVLLLVL